MSSDRIRLNFGQMYDAENVLKACHNELDAVLGQCRSATSRLDPWAQSGPDGAAYLEVWRRLDRNSAEVHQCLHRLGSAIAANAGDAERVEKQNVARFQGMRS